MSALLGTTLSGRYRLEARVGSGGMSTVYRALDETLQRHVAIKLMNREVAGDSDQLERFRREARAVAQLSHPNVVGVIDAGEDLDPAHPRPFIVFEYVEGETLKERIRRNGRLPIPEAVAYTIEIARALGAAHARHIVHRDVKPQNVMIDEEGTAKVTDFGIARTLDEDGLTADGRVLGTTDYVSPEQALGQPVNGQSDLYSLGIVLWEMLSGEVPFKGENQVAVAMRHVREPLPDIRAFRPEVSAALAQVIDLATAKRPDGRYADDQELIADLEDVLAIETARSGQATGEATTVLRTLPRSARRRVPFAILHRRLLAPIALLAVLVVIGLGLLLASASHKGSGTPGIARAAVPAHGLLVHLCANCATAYNPDGLNGDISQNNANAPQAIDGSASTGWGTDQYYDHRLDKPGVGLYLDTRPGSAHGLGSTATRLGIQTSTPGFAATIYATDRMPDPTSFDASGWVPVGHVANAAGTQTVSLDHPNTRYGYYLVWITSLPANAMSVTLNELKLYS